MDVVIEELDLLDIRSLGILAASVVIAAFISYRFIDLILRADRRQRGHDREEERKLPKTPRPRLGGVGIFVSFFVTIYLLVFTIFLAGNSLLEREFDIQPAVLFLYVGAIFFVFILGVLDDFFNLKPLPKLLVETVVAVVLYFIGFRIEYISIPFGVGFLVLGLFSLPMTVLWIVGVINAINLIDGLDGLAGGIVAITSTTMIVILLIQGQFSHAILLAPLLGGTLGFLPFNLYPSRIIMGDSGSLFAGVVLSSIMLLIPQKAAFGITLLVPFAILALPILDTTLAFSRRLLRRQSPFRADADHIHHRFLQKGHDEAKTVKILLLLSLFFSLLAVLFHTSSQKVRSFLLLVLFIAILGLLRYLEYIRVKKT